MSARKLKSLLQSHGFTLIEMMVVLAIGAVLAGGTATLFRNIGRSTRAMNGAVDLQVQVSSLVGLFSTPTSCRNSMNAINQSLNPLNVAPNNNVRIDTGDGIIEAGRFLPGNQDLYINFVRAELFPIAAPSPAAVRWMKFVNPAPSPAPPFQYCHGAEARYRITMEIENIAAGRVRTKNIGLPLPGTPRQVGGRAQGASIFTRSLTLNTLMKYDATCVGYTSGPTPAEPGAPTAGNNTNWQVDRCSTTSQGLQITGAGRCYWCPRQTSDEGNDACALGTNIFAQDNPAPAPAKPQLAYRTRTPLQLAVQEARLLNDIFTVVPRAEAQAESPGTVGDPEYISGVGNVQNDVPTSPTTSTGTIIASPQPWPSGAGEISTKVGAPAVCSEGWYQAGFAIQEKALEQLPGTYTPPAVTPCYANGKYASCSSHSTTNINGPTRTIMRYAVLCCEVATE